ncbi:MAG: SpoIIE family protein phosphatase [Bacteroidales bacterium]|nr:MAG: SpoIIE family protein phosphatase [Bacteroidales bacterium]
MHETTDLQVTDGMDLALCCFNPKTMTLQFAGAQRPLLLLQNNEIPTFKGTRHSIGMPGKGNQCFMNHDIAVKKGDLVYLFSDGFPDQFGGAEGKKYLMEGFTDLLLNIHTLPMDEQKDKLDATLREWMGTLDQVDDILVMGIRIW